MIVHLAKVGGVLSFVFIVLFSFLFDSLIDFLFQSFCIKLVEAVLVVHALGVKMVAKEFVNHSLRSVSIL